MLVYLFLKKCIFCFLIVITLLGVQLFIFSQHVCMVSVQQNRNECKSTFSAVVVNDKQLLKKLRNLTLFYLLLPSGLEVQTEQSYCRFLLTVKLVELTRITPQYRNCLLFLV